MKITKEKTLKYKLRKNIQAMDSKIILRQEIQNLTDKRQLSRALKALIEEGYLAKLGYGIYTKTEIVPETGDVILKAPFSDLVKETLDKLGIDWDLTQAQKDYNEGRTTQVPVRPGVRLKDRFRRKLAFHNQRIYFEGNIYAR
ncbi:MAG: hypothetical protein JW855_02910 [Gammaproteobacteria bacterium]|nr:hypothetical protein [Gammaproteobacteria bacterium]